MHYCVLDTSAILQRFQPANQNAQRLIDSLYQNKKIEIYIPHVCISETIQQFYHAYRLSQKEPSPMSTTERTGLISRLRQDINDGKLNIYPTEASLFAKSEMIFDVSFTIKPRGEDPIDMADLLVIATTLEFLSLADGVEGVYLFSSDRHLLDVATALKIQCWDSTLARIDQLPPCFDRRIMKRNSVQLNTVCKDCTTGDVYGPTKILDICEYGICVEQTKRNINIGDRVNFSIPPFGNLKEENLRTGIAVRVENGQVGVQLEEPLIFN